MRIFRGTHPCATKAMNDFLDNHLGIKRSPLTAEKCGRFASDTPEDWTLDREDLVVHVPKDSIIVTIIPNMVPEGAKKAQS